MGTLSAALAALKKKKDAGRDPAATALMNRATSDLRDSGILNRVLSVGSPAPLFARPNLTGRTVRLRALLKNGPVVVSFFRGRW